MKKTLIFLSLLILSVSITACQDDATDSTNTAQGTSDYVFEPFIDLNSTQAAVQLIGQVDFETDNPSSEAMANTFVQSRSPVYIANNLLYIADNSDNRVLIFDENVSDFNASAIAVLGQKALNEDLQGQDANEMKDPYHVTAYNGKLIVTENGNHRVIIYDEIPSETNSSASIVLGQSDFGIYSFGCAKNQMYYPEASFAVNDKLMVVDNYNSRVLIWNKFPTSSGTLPDLVLGQKYFTTCASNDKDFDGSVDTNYSSDAFTLNSPKGVWSDGIRLIVADSFNARVLIWNTFPTQNGQAADLVLGQGDFTHQQSRDDNQDNVKDAVPSSRVLSGPTGIFVNDTQLFIADTSNHRVLIWDTFPTYNFQPADKVLGQIDFESADKNITSSTTLKDPMGIFQKENKLYITDTSHDRILIYEGN